MNRFFIAMLAVGVLIYTESCNYKVKGCMQNVECVENFDPDAEEPGECTGCTNEDAYNYCDVATIESGICVFQRDLYTTWSSNGWIDIWISDSVDNWNDDYLTYAGRVPPLEGSWSLIPDCNSGNDSILTITKPAGEYYYESETQAGNSWSGWIEFREEGCRLDEL